MVAWGVSGWQEPLKGDEGDGEHASFDVNDKPVGKKRAQAKPRLRLVMAGGADSEDSDEAGEVDVDGGDVADDGGDDSDGTQPYPAHCLLS